MLLPLRRNHFFRSSWNIMELSKFTAENLKYFDLDAVDMKTWSHGCKSKKKSLYGICSPVDVSYWNTYNTTSTVKSIFGTLLDMYLYRVSGVKNLRTDDMCALDFKILLNYSSPEHYVVFLNPHWNLYRRRRSVRLRAGIRKHSS
jgi:hypothetical protein